MPNAPVPSQPRVQVFIPVYNDITYLPRAVASVLDQDGVNLGLVVSDNASTDGTYEYICDVAAADPRVIVHRNPENLGHMRNLNRFAECVAADYYMLLCSDDMLGSPTALQQAVAILDNMPEVVSVYSDMLYIDGHDRKLMTRRFREAGVFDSRAAFHDSVVSLRNMFGIPLLHRRSACADLRYPEHLGYVGDVWFSMQAALRGQVYHIPGELIWNRYTGRNLTAVLNADSSSQFSKLLEMSGLLLSRSDRVRQSCARYIVAVQRYLFLCWARWRTERLQPH
jgi:glycosyltransferase involved in cell wall biosynthesis